MGEGADYDLAARYEAELGLRQGPLTKLLGPTVVDDLAVVGSDPYLREGSDLSLVFSGCARAPRSRRRWPARWPRSAPRTAG